MNKAITLFCTIIVICVFSAFALACGGGSSDSGSQNSGNDDRWAGENYDYDNDNQWDDNEWNDALDDYLDENGY